MIGPAQDKPPAAIGNVEIIEGFPVGQCLTWVIDRRFHVDQRDGAQSMHRLENGLTQIDLQVTSARE